MSSIWIESLKAGDKVIVNCFGSTVHVVGKVTKAQVVLADGRRFSKNSHRLIGAGRFSRSMLLPATDEAIEEIAEKKLHEALVSKIGGVRIRSLSLQALKEISDVIDRHPIISRVSSPL